MNTPAISPVMFDGSAMSYAAYLDYLQGEIRYANDMQSAHEQSGQAHSALVFAQYAVNLWCELSALKSASRAEYYRAIYEYCQGKPAQSAQSIDTAQQLSMF